MPWQLSEEVPLSLSDRATAKFDPGCSLIPGVVVKLGSSVLAGSMVLSAVGPLPPHDGGD